MPITKKTQSKKPKKATKTTQSKIKKALKETPTMLEMIISNIPQHIFWKDINSVFMGCNENFAHTVGLKNPDDIVGKTDYDLIDKEKALHFITLDKKVIETDKPIYKMIESHKTSDGNLIWLSINKVPLHDKNGKVIGVLGTFENITERINLEKKLKRNEKKYRELIEATETSYIILDDKLKILEANDKYVKLIGYKEASKLIGHNPRSWVIDKDIKAFDKAFKSVLRGNLINNLEIQLINEKGKSVGVSISANIIENGGKRIFCLIRDVSHKMTMEAKRYIEKQKQKDRLRQNIMEIRRSIKKFTF